MASLLSRVLGTNLTMAGSSLVSANIGSLGMVSARLASTETKVKNPRVFLDVTANEKKLPRMVFELRADIAPKTAENFRLLCTGEKGYGYKGSFFHTIIPGHIAQGGDSENQIGTGGKSAYGEDFPIENFVLKHSYWGLLSMAHAGPLTCGSQFFITLNSVRQLDNVCSVFGHLVEGEETLFEIEKFGQMSGMVSKRVVIENCGVVE